MRVAFCGVVCLCTWTGFLFFYAQHGLYQLRLVARVSAIFDAERQQSFFFFFFKEGPIPHFGVGQVAME